VTISLQILRKNSFCSKALILPITFLILRPLLERAPQVKGQRPASLSSVVNMDRTCSLLLESAAHSGRFNDHSIIHLGVGIYRGRTDIHKNHVRTCTACVPNGTQSKMRSCFIT
jgi:hypothetical protein